VKDENQAREQETRIVIKGGALLPWEGEDVDAKQKYKLRAHAMWTAFEGDTLGDDPVYARHAAWVRETIDALVDDGYLPVVLFERDAPGDDPSSTVALGERAEGALIDWEGGGVELTEMRWTENDDERYGTPYSGSDADAKIAEACRELDEK
jgi:hypothetical protein